MKRKPTTIFKVTVHARVPALNPGGFLERKSGEWMMRRADEIKRTATAYVLTKSWVRGEWRKTYPKR